MRRFILLIIMSALSVVAFSQSNGAKLAHYDEAAILHEMKQAEDVERKLKTLAEQYESEMNRMEDEYARKASDYQKNYANWDETIRKMRMEELQTLKTKMQNYYEMAQKSIDSKREDLYGPIMKRIKEAVAQVAQDYNFLYVFDINTVKYISPDALDITVMVKRKLGIK